MCPEVPVTILRYKNRYRTYVRPQENENNIYSICSQCVKKQRFVKRKLCQNFLFLLSINHFYLYKSWKFIKKKNFLLYIHHLPPRIHRFFSQKIQTSMTPKINPVVKLPNKWNKHLITFIRSCFLFSDVVSLHGQWRRFRNSAPLPSPRSGWWVIVREIWDQYDL